MTTVDLGDAEQPVRVEVEFLASDDVEMRKNHPKLVEGFRVLRFPAFAAAFTSPVSIDFSGPMISGAANTVHLRVASLPDFLIMKAHALGRRDKPKDVYDLCYCLDEFPDAIEAVAVDWRARQGELLIAGAGAILQEKFQRWCPLAVSSARYRLTRANRNVSPSINDRTGRRTGSASFRPQACRGCANQRDEPH